MTFMYTGVRVSIRCGFSPGPATNCVTVGKSKRDYFKQMKVRFPHPSLATGFFHATAGNIINVVM